MIPIGFYDDDSVDWKDNESNEEYDSETAAFIVELTRPQPAKYTGKKPTAKARVGKEKKIKRTAKRRSTGREHS